MNQDTVDGCAIFYHTCVALCAANKRKNVLVCPTSCHLLSLSSRTKYRLKQEYLIEFERLSTRYASGCTDMLNRVMPKVRPTESLRTLAGKGSQSFNSA